MGSVRKEVVIAAPIDAVWDAVRDVGAIHTRLCPGMVTSTKLEDGARFRIVTFEDGLVLRERIIAVDNATRRLVWSVVDGPFEHHNASVDVIGDSRRCRVIWTADLLPHELTETVANIMERGLSLTKQTQEALAISARYAKSNPQEDRERYVFCPAIRPTLHHVGLFVSDLEESTRFYTDGLGLSLREEFRDIIGRRDFDEFPFGVASVFLEAGDGRYIELHPASPESMSEPAFPLNHFALGVMDVDAAYARALEEGGVPCDIPIPEQHWNGTPLNVVMKGDRPESMRMAFVLGPSGELIELYQAAAAS